MKSLYAELIGFLKRLDMQVMILGTHCTDEGQMKGAYKNLSPVEFVELVLSHSFLNNSKVIGTTEDNRELHLLYR